MPKSDPAVFSCDLLKATCTLLKTYAAVGAVVQSRNRIPPTCPCTSWGLAPTMSFSPSSLLLLETQSIQLHWDSINLWDFYSIYLSNFLLCFFFFFHPLSPFSCLSLPQTLVSSFWHDEHFSLLTPSDFAFCCLSSPT